MTLLYELLARTLKKMPPIKAVRQGTRMTITVPILSVKECIA
jgi:L-lysine 2,3-aminomutase